MIRFPCPHCGKELVAAFEKEGRRARCSSCETVFVVPSHEPPPAAEIADDFNEFPSDHEFPSDRGVRRALTGISGWLILPALWLTLGTVVHAVQLIFGYFSLFHIFFRSVSEGVLLVWVLMLLDTALFGFRLYVAFRFFGCHRSVPKLMIVFLVISLASCWCNWLLDSFMSDKIADPTRFLLVGIFCAIWIPYFLVSRRVKATFVNGSTKANERVTPLSPGSFTVEHDIALDLLKQNGPVVANNQEEERILADIAAAGFARKEGNAYVHTGSRGEGTFWAKLKGAATGLKNTGTNVPLQRARREAKRRVATRSVARILRPRTIVVAGILCVGLLALYVPWKQTWGPWHAGEYSHPGGSHIAGYHFIFDPPQPPPPEPRTEFLGGYEIDVPRMILPMLAVICTTIAAAVWTAKTRPKEG